MNTVKEELEYIQSKNKGLLRPVDVVEFAKNPETILHGKFCWDDRIAGERYRLQQARQIIQVEVSVVPKTEKTVRAFVSLFDDRKRPGGGYRQTTKVLSQKQKREKLLVQALIELRSWAKKYNDLKALIPIFEAVEKVTKEVEKKQATPASTPLHIHQS